MSPFPWELWLIGTLTSLTGIALLVLNSWWSPATRRMGRDAHWYVGFGVNGLGMILLGAGWIFLAGLPPRWDADWLFFAGLAAAVGGGALYLVSATRVGRLRLPGQYTNDLETKGLYAIIRHPQALALALMAIGLGGISRSIPYLVSLPLFLTAWYLYSWFEEKFEMIPVFGDRYVEYCRRTPRMFPSPVKTGRMIASLKEEAASRITSPRADL
jgi:protein-S-isoprenylcysteine O-methyltransferase Ste14